MVFDGFFIHHLILELNTSISKSRIEKVYQTSNDTFLLVLFAKGQRYKLKIDLSPNRFGMYLSKTDEKNQTTSQFLITLKKHIEGGILENISQHKTDRVMILNITSYDFIDGPISKQLIFEAMGKHSNLILVYDGLIVDTFKKMFFESGRQLLPQAKFEFFPSDKTSFFNMTYRDLVSPKHLVNHFLGISPFLSEYIIQSNILPKDIKINPCRSIELKKDYVADVFLNDTEKVYFHSISEMMDQGEILNQPQFLSHQNFILKNIDKLSKKIENLDALLEEANLNLSYKSKGDLIYQSGQNMNSKLHELSVYDEKITLDPTKTLNENAQYFYKLYQKAKKSIVHIENQIQESKTLVNHFYSLSQYIHFTSQDSIRDLETELSNYGYKKLKTPKINKKQASKPNIIKIIEPDAIYLIGKNNIQNEYVTHSLANKEDYWFHVKDATGAHVVVQTKNLSEGVLRKAAIFAAYFSSMRESSSIPVDYTEIRHIKKIPKLPGYQVTYKNHRTIYIDINHDLLSKYL